MFLALMLQNLMQYNDKNGRIMTMSFKLLIYSFKEKTGRRDFFKIYRDIFKLSTLYVDYEISALTTLKQPFGGAGAL